MEGIQNGVAYSDTSPRRPIASLRPRPGRIPTSGPYKTVRKEPGSSLHVRANPLRLRHRQRSVKQSCALGLRAREIPPSPQRTPRILPEALRRRPARGDSRAEA